MSGANSQLPLASTHMLLLLYKCTAESTAHLATQTLVLTIGLPVWNWWQTADGQKLESETNQEVNEEKNYSSFLLPPLLRSREREVEGEGWGSMRSRTHIKSSSQRHLVTTGSQPYLTKIIRFTQNLKLVVYTWIATFNRPSSLWFPETKRPIVNNSFHLGFIADHLSK